MGQAIISVKGGENVHANHVRDLLGTMHSQNAIYGVFVTLTKPTRAMIQAAREAGSAQFGGKLRPRLQIKTIEELLAGGKPDLPPVYDIIAAASAFRRQKKLPVPPTPQEIRERPQFKLPISGGRKGDAQTVLLLEEPLLVSPRETDLRREGAVRARSAANTPSTAGKPDA